ncbi:MAG: hypothetical protein MSA66_08605, partial [Oscillospiraceae bacterium]|nr:hypothetical protein [Oscillospiraceae bacterium]
SAAALHYLCLLFFGFVIVFRVVVCFVFFGRIVLCLLEQGTQLFEYHYDTCEDEGSQSEVRIKAVKKSRNDKIQPFAKQENYNQKYRI